MFEIREDDLSSVETRALLALHLAGMHANSPPESVFALDLSGLQAPEVTVWTAWRDGRAASVGALKMLGDGAAEVKSMRTHPDFLRMGAGAAILEVVIAAAKARAVQRLSLETGSGPPFEPALALYRRRGFTNGSPFSDYRPSAFSQCLHLELYDASSPPLAPERRSDGVAVSQGADEERVSGTMKTGGCQCGSVRFAVDGKLGRASLCHCRMCQKAFGSFYGPLVSAPGLRWTRGGPKYFRSSNLVQRGFCEHCGTPLTFEPDAGIANVAIGALDDPNTAVPVIQLALSERLPWVEDLASLPGEAAQEREETEAYYARIVSFQHPDHDTARWPESMIGAG